MSLQSNFAPMWVDAPRTPTDNYSAAFEYAFQCVQWKGPLGFFFAPSCKRQSEYIMTVFCTSPTRSLDDVESVQQLTLSFQKLDIHFVFEVGAHYRDDDGRDSSDVRLAIRQKPDSLG